MAEKVSPSKRKALRYRLSNKQISYMTAAGELGQANLENISTSGCLLSKYSSTVNKDEHVLIIVELANQSKPLELKATVNRVEKDQFSAVFTHLQESFALQLTTMLAKEIRNNQVE